MEKSHNKPPVTIELDEEMEKFIVANCESNMTWGLAILQSDVKRETAEAVVAMLEKFKKLKKLVEDSRGS